MSAMKLESVVGYKSGNDLSEEGTVKEGWRYYTENLYKRDDNMTTIMRQRNVKKKQRY